MRFRKLIAAVVTVSMLGMLAACGKGAEDAGSDSEKAAGKLGVEASEASVTGADAEGLVWTASWDIIYTPSVQGAMSVNVAADRVVDGKLYFKYSQYGEEYVSEYCSLDVSGGDAKWDDREVIMNLSDGGTDGSIGNISVAPDGGIVYTLTQYDEEGMQVIATYLIRKDPSGAEVYRTDLAAALRDGGEDRYVNSLIVQGDGTVMLQANGSNGYSIFVMDAAGQPVTKLDRDDYAKLGILPDGRAAYVAALDNDWSHFVLYAYNPQAKDFTDRYENLPPDAYNAVPVAGEDGSIVIQVGGKIYTYDLESQTATPYMNLLDCDINQDYVSFATTLADGRVLCLLADWDTGEISKAVLSKVPASEVTPKIQLTLATMYTSQGITGAVINYNKQSDTVHVNIKDYTEGMDYSSETGYSEAAARFQTDLTGPDAPDMYVPSGMENIRALVGKGAIEDLSPYLDSSKSLHRDDLFESVLRANTIDGCLYAIPRSFFIQTLVGRTADVGDKPGWTMDEMLALHAAHPKAQLIACSARSYALQQLFNCNQGQYIDWVNGSCNFDSPEFRSLLELASTFPETPDYERSEASLIRSGDALLYQGFMSNYTDIEVASAIYGEPVTYIGLPTIDGTPGNYIQTGDSCIVMLSSSRHKDECWDFYEAVLTSENKAMSDGFPVRKSEFEEGLAAAMKAEYDKEYDEATGEWVDKLDADGNKIELPVSTYGWGDVSIDLKAVTDKEAENLRDLIDSAQGFNVYYLTDEYRIIEEEAEAYFKGDKSLDEVCDVIQSRMKIFVSESQ